jgi:hypothetical protein
MLRPARSGLLAVTALTAVTVTSCSSAHHAAPPTTTTTATDVSPSPSPAAATCPLTGLPPRPGQNVHRVALALKIDNVDAARPQAGLDHADVVIEETVEGGLTRLMAIFQCGAAATVGPIRSARTSDGDLLRLLDGAVFGFSGANPRALAPVAATSRAVLISYDNLPQYFHRASSRPAPHNVFSSTATVLGAGLARRHGLHAPPPVFAYGAVPAGARPVHQLSVTWPAASAGWTWNGHAWLRTQNGTPDVLTDGHRAAAANVVVMSITTRATGLHDVLGNASPDDVVTGHGKVWVLRDGALIRGTWRRPTRVDPMRLTDLSGNALNLAPGVTWVELLPRPRHPHYS